MAGSSGSSAVTLRGQIKPTKTESNRTIGLTAPLSEVLAAWRKQVLRQGLPKSDFIFGTRQTGRPLNVRRVGRLFRYVLKQAEVGHFKLYDLRHTVASLLLRQGVNLLDVARMLGHAKPTTTLAFYAHWHPGDDISFVDRLTDARQAKNPQSGDLNR